MGVLFGDDVIKIRQLSDCLDDYNLLLTWLSDSDVCEYYEGRTKPFHYDMVLEKFEERAKGIDPVTVGIIEYGEKAIGFVQFYTTEPGEYHEADVINMNKYKRSYEMDIVIGDKIFWNQGVGTRTMKLLAEFLFEKKGADLLLIAPQMWNMRAIRCYEKTGFKKIIVRKEMELHDDKYVDGVLMAKAKNDLLWQIAR